MARPTLRRGGDKRVPPRGSNIGGACLSWPMKRDGLSNTAPRRRQAVPSEKPTEIALFWQDAGHKGWPGKLDQALVPYSPVVAIAAIPVGECPLLRVTGSSADPSLTIADVCASSPEPVHPRAAEPVGRVRDGSSAQGPRQSHIPHRHD